MVASTPRLLSLTGLHLHVHPNPGTVTARLRLSYTLPQARVPPSTRVIFVYCTSQPGMCGGTPTARRGGVRLRDVHAVNRVPSVQSPCKPRGAFENSWAFARYIPVRRREKKNKVCFDYFPISCHILLHTVVCARTLPSPLVFNWRGKGYGSLQYIVYQTT